MRHANAVARNQSLVAYDISKIKNQTSKIRKFLPGSAGTPWPDGNFDFCILLFDIYLSRVRVFTLVSFTALLLFVIGAAAPMSAQAQARLPRESVGQYLSPAFAAASAEQAEFEKRMTKFTLANGLKFLVLERHEVPVVSLHTYADVGSVDEVKGITGLAHLFEHMAFKGTKAIGTKKYKAEAQALVKMDGLFEAMKAERRTRLGDPATARSAVTRGPSRSRKGEQALLNENDEGQADKSRLEQLDKQFKEAEQEAQKYIVHDEYEEILTRAGGEGFNAYTSKIATQYIVSLPSNKVELWMLLESDRFCNAVLREFYKEKDVVMEERRMSENNPQFRLFEEFEAIAYKAHPYGEPVIGHMSDLQTLTRGEAEAFFRKYYSPSNLTIAMVGDVNPKQVKALAEKYFSRIPGGPKPDPVETVEPPQRGERRVVVEDKAQPLVVIGYHTPNVNHPDNAVLDTMAEIIGVGRTSRLYKSIVKEKKIAVAASASSGGSKYPSLFMFRAVPAKGHTPDECEKAVYAEIEKLKAELVSPEELRKAKTRSRADLIRELDSNPGLAAELTFYEVVTGDWRNLFVQLDRIDKVTAEDIQRVAKEYFTSKNRTVGMIKTVDSD